MSLAWTSRSNSLPALAAVNKKIINLTACVASAMARTDDSVTIQFDIHVPGNGQFCVQLNGVIRFVDDGLLFQNLTTGLVWDISGEFGRSNSLSVGRENTDGLIELILDYQDDLLHRRFQAVADSVRCWDGPISRSDST